ncbi:MAG TPA: CPBP family intramembrane glutamic endopeptidase [Lacipirellulaceae bacterium]|nr:CPBP family intramembrane glutamic endopeptidase [Lacipirellulaceae bacterium]
MDSTAERSNGFAMAVVVEGGIAVIALLIAWIFHVPLKERLPALGAPLALAIARGLLATLPMLVVFWLLVNSNTPMLRRLRAQVEWLIREMFPSGSIAQFAMVAALAGVGEELLFRGTLQSKIGGWTTPVVGLLITSFLFGLAHALSKLYFLFAFGVGCFLGWLMLRYNDLAAPMVAHGVYDFIALTYLSHRVSTRVEKSPPLDNERPSA